MEEDESLVLFTLNLKISDFWENRLAEEFPDVSFVVQRAHPSGERSFSGLLKMENGDVRKIQSFLNKNYPKVVLEPFCRTLSLFHYSDLDCFLADVLKDTNCVLCWPVKFDKSSKKIKLILRRKYVDKIMGSLEREKVKVLSFSITNVDLDFNEVLTPKQREILSSSLELGYYRFPRKVSLNGLAEKLGISPSTLCVHLQKIESKFLNPNHLELIFGERI